MPESTRKLLMPPKLARIWANALVTSTSLGNALEAAEQDLGLGRQLEVEGVHCRVVQAGSFGILIESSAYPHIVATIARLDRGQDGLDKLNKLANPGCGCLSSLLLVVLGLAAFVSYVLSAPFHTPGQTPVHHAAQAAEILGGTFVLVLVATIVTALVRLLKRKGYRRQLQIAQRQLAGAVARGPACPTCQGSGSVFYPEHTRIHPERSTNYSTDSDSAIWATSPGWSETVPAHWGSCRQCGGTGKTGPKYDTFEVFCWLCANRRTFGSEVRAASRFRISATQRTP